MGEPGSWWQADEGSLSLEEVSVVVVSRNRPITVADLCHKANVVHTGLVLILLVEVRTWSVWPRQLVP